jgi:hypothetical protein
MNIVQEIYGPTTGYDKTREARSPLMGITFLDRGSSLIMLVSLMEKELQMDIAGMAAQACQFLCVEEGEGRTV